MAGQPGRAARVWGQPVWLGSPCVWAAESGHAGVGSLVAQVVSILGSNLKRVTAAEALWTSDRLGSWASVGEGKDGTRRGHPSEDTHTPCV